MEKNKDRKPLIVKGARQIGKTESIRNFAKNNYKNIVEINFVLQKQFKDIFDEGFDVDTIIKNISLRRPELEFTPNETLIFFDEIQDCINCATSLKSFREDGRYDVICSGSLMGINYNEIESNSVGNKEDYEMYSMDFEEFLWAKGYKEKQIENLYEHMKNLEPFSNTELSVMFENFKEYMIIGGMPAIVNEFVKNKNYSGTLKMQKQILSDYEEDITKYAKGLKCGKILSVYRKIPVFLGKENKKFQISKVESGARNREYLGTIEWLDNAGIINICYCLEQTELPLGGNYNPDNYRIFFRDTGLLIGSLDEEAQDDLRNNKNFNTYKGAIYENIIADMLVKEGYKLYFYKNEKGTLEMDFFIRDKDSLIPVEVKANDGYYFAGWSYADNGFDLGKRKPTDAEVDIFSDLYDVGTEKSTYVIEDDAPKVGEDGNVVYEEGEYFPAVYALYATFEPIRISGYSLSGSNTTHPEEGNKVCTQTVTFTFSGENIDANDFNVPAIVPADANWTVNNDFTVNSTTKSLLTHVRLLRAIKIWHSMTVKHIRAIWILRMRNLLQVLRHVQNRLSS